MLVEAVEVSGSWDKGPPPKRLAASVFFFCFDPLPC